MATKTYQEMQDRIADELKRTDLSVQIQRAIQDSIVHFKDENFSAAESYVTIDTVDGQWNYDLPVDFASAVQWQIAYDATVVPMKVETIQTLMAWNTDRTEPRKGRPLWVAIWGDQFYTWPIPQEDDYEFRLWYHSNISAPTAGTDTGYWMNEAERLIRTYAKGLIYSDVLKQYDRQIEEEKLSETEYNRLIDRLEARHLDADIVPWS